MSKSKYRLVISLEADKDLETIYEYGFKRWNEAQADRYYDAIIEHFNILCDTPYLFRAVGEIRTGYRRSVCGKHAVYYRIVDDTVEIMALVKNEDRP